MSTNIDAKISYPCSWSYKVIGADKNMVKEAAITILTAHGKKYSLQYAHASRTGKYHSWGITLNVASEMERNFLFAELKNHPQIKVVI